jgi:sulfatase modifying factor 1
MRAPRATIAMSVLAGTLVSCELLINTSHLDSETDASSPDEGGKGSDAGVHHDGDARDAARSDGHSDVLAADASCPNGHGPKMIRVGTYCIDSTEVTGADYAAFVEAGTGTSLEPPECAWKNGSWDNGGEWTLVNGPTGPAGDVDWCDAYVYCKWAGKRLCGAIDGGSVPYDSYADETKDQWFAACGGADATAYPYGNEFDQSACNGLLADGGYPDGATTYTVEPVASKKTCQGGYPGIFDMSGNVAEWEDCCDVSSGGDAAAQPCRYRGGSAHSSEDELTCATGESFGVPYDRGRHDDDLGFRCCSR